MFNLSETERNELIRAGLLSVDEEGDDVLLGLTVAESEFYLAHRRACSLTLMHPDAFVFLQIHRRHFAACVEAFNLFLTR